MKRQFQGFGAVLAFIAMLVGAWKVVRLASDVLNQAQGKCDFVPCVWPWTFPSMAGFGLLLVAGAAVLTWMVFGHGGLLRRPR